MKDAGRVKRMHVNNGPLHTIDEHVYSVLMIIILFHPNPSAELLKAAALHDMPERVTGDVPAPIKWQCPEIGRELAKLESRIFQAVLEYDPMSRITTADHLWIKAADSFDLWLTCCDYWYRGYHFCEDYMRALEREILNAEPNMLPATIKAYWDEVVVSPGKWIHATKEISG